MLQYLIGSVLIVSTWHYHSTEFAVLTMFIIMNIHQTLVLLLNAKYSIASSVKLTLIIVFMDGIVSGLLIQFLGLSHTLSLGMGGLFLLVYFKAFSRTTYAAIFGITGAIFIAHKAHFPTCNLEATTEIVLLVLMVFFLLAFCLIRHHQDKSLNDKLELQFAINKSLKLHVRTLSKYLSPKLSKSIISNNSAHVIASDKPLTIFFSDMQGFSQLSEQLDPDKLSWVVNSFLSEMTNIVFRFGGTLDKMIGDSIMVFFGDPNSRGKKNDAIACVCMAIAMREAMSRLQIKWQKEAINNPPNVRMGINTGNCRVGNFGPETKLDYTVVGTTVNLASYLESIAQPDEILITEETYNLVKNQVKCTRKNSANCRWLSKQLKLYSADSMTSGLRQSTGHCLITDNL